jgi:hypothetical protein
LPGIYRWRDTHGQIYLVDHTGTHKITSPEARTGAATGYDPAIEIYPTDLTIDTDPAG